MNQNKLKKICVFLLITFFGFYCLWNIINTQKSSVRILKVISPIEFKLTENNNFSIKGYQTFDSYYSDNNKNLAIYLNITEDEAFILGHLGKYWAKNCLEGKNIMLSDNDIIIDRAKYSLKFQNSPFAIKNGKPADEFAYKKQLNSVRKGKYVILNLDNDRIYSINCRNSKEIDNYVVVRKSHVKKAFEKNKKDIINSENYFKFEPKSSFKSVYDDNTIKLVISDHTKKLNPDRACSSDICKEILQNIKSSQISIDIAIYGYSSTPDIEKAIAEAQKRGVKIRVVYDLDSNGKNIYPDTFKFINMFTNSNSDINSPESGKTMHNKFYIFDKEIVITGSANLSHTDMSGYNSNAIVVIKNADIAKVYTNEFEQMYGGKFHNDKISQSGRNFNNIKIFFSPQDKGITNGILPLIRSSKKYVYIPTFIITHKAFVQELINAKMRGVDVKIIVDSLNATGAYSKHKELRKAEIPVKAENYAGKMHSKSIIIDDEYLVIGSMNFSNSGENKNDENMIIIHNPGASVFYRNNFLEQWSRIPDKWLKHVPRAEGFDSIGSCKDGVDNNYDGKIDGSDLGCIKK